jgi:hypothetical protein
VGATEESSLEVESEDPSEVGGYRSDTHHQRQKTQQGEKHNVVNEDAFFQQELDVP